MTDRFEIAAMELIERYGDKALERAEERVATLQTSGEPTELDMALMVLSQLEKFDR